MNTETIVKHLKECGATEWRFLTEVMFGRVTRRDLNNALKAGIIEAKRVSCDGAGTIKIKLKGE